MSDQEQETLADIVADIRERAENAMRNGERLVHNEAVAMLLRSVADRLEAAAKRDEERAVEHATRHAEAVARDNCRDCVHNPSGKNYEGGNAAAMREALVFLRDQELWMLEGNVRHCVGLTVFGLEQVCKIMRGVIEEALSAPPRNCDVGTMEEQGERCLAQFEQWRRNGDGKKLITAIMTWAQMPYEASEISRAHRAGEKTTNQTTRNNNEQ